MRLILIATIAHSVLPAAELTESIVPSDLIFEEKDGVVSFEAEHFYKQENSEKRAWYLTTAEIALEILPDGDPPCTADSSGAAYLEILPDTRRTHSDKMVKGENFTENPGEVAVLTYKVHFNTPGTYHIWARVYSTTSEDNGLHFGINGTWPDTAKRWQTVVKNKWHWRSAQRTEQKHAGVPGILTIEVPSAGLHKIQVSMREDGIALDKILLTNSKEYTPEETGPATMIKSGKLPLSPATGSSPN
ncbi:hypothetical protein [Luteolibacter sp. AS25]|uniref:hypothetical protein n=1 Tax=Luteolibacter sp. AS25 TaxID=3135776 RepID=UPI00398B5066